MKTEDEFIRSILQEEQRVKEQHKKRKAHEYESKKKELKGKTLGEWEQEEGGPIQEAQVAMAHTKRVARRGEVGGAADDTRILGVEDLEKAEQDLTVEEEGGVKIEPFNLKEERERGHFDEAGNYVEDAKESDEEEEDAWLKSGEASVVSEEVRQRLEEREKRERTADDDDEAAPLTATQIARLQHEAARLLEPGETLAAGLRRLAKKGPKEAQQSTEEKARFDRLTELGSLLMDAGEMDVYTQTKEYFARAAAVYIDEDEGPSSLFSSGLKSGGTAAYEEADEDMFGGNSDDDENKRPAQESTRQGENHGAAKASGAEGIPDSKTTEDFKAHYASWPIKELRRFLTERGADASACVEKDDLINRVAEIARAEAEKTVSPPAGYSLDAASGYYYSAESGLYWDPKSGGFYDGQSGKWFSWDSSTQQFVEWK